MRQYKRISKNPQASVPCPICNKLVIPRGMGGHMRLTHADFLNKQVSDAVKQLNEPELPFEVESVSKATKRPSKPLSAEQQLYQNRLLFVGFVGIAIAYMVKAHKLAKQQNIINLRESQKLQEARKRAIDSRMRVKNYIVQDKMSYSSTPNEY